MAKYTRINFTVTSKIDNEIKQAAKDKGLSISEYCRQKISENIEAEELNPVTIENRIEQVERILADLMQVQWFLSEFIYEFMVMAKDENVAKRAKMNAEKSINRKLNERG